MFHFYTLKTKNQREIKETISFSTIKKNKIPRNKPPKETEDLSSGNCKMLMKETEMTQTDGKIYQCSWIGGINTVK